MYKVFFIFLFVSILGKAQELITIPDQKFALFLKETYPTCFKNDKLDISNPLIQFEDTLLLSTLFIKDFEGLEFFKNLKVLDISSNLGTTLPHLSNRLTNLNISNNLFQTLPNLSTHLVYLDCSNNRLTSIQYLSEKLDFLNVSHNQLDELPKLPKHLSVLFCNDNNIKHLPSLNNLKELNCSNNNIQELVAIPTHLLSLDCSHNQITTLPILGSKLSNLNCSFNQLKALPELPQSIEILDCSVNQIFILPTLTSKLLKLNCTENSLKALPVLPSKLNELLCASNQLVRLPKLPINLKVLWCSFNQLDQLPTLPLLTYFYANNNVLTCLPQLPSTIEFGDITSNEFSCIPSKGDWMNEETLNFPVCKFEKDPFRINCLDQPGQLSLSSDKNESKSTISVYPNPTNKIVFVEAMNKIDLVKVMDIEGKIAYLVEPNTEKIEIDLSELMNGVYFIQITIDSSTTIDKVIKTN